jgi:hypothetical protein
MLSEIALEPNHKSIITEYSLSPHICPDRCFSDPLPDKVSVFFLGHRRGAAELSEHPRCRETGVLLTTACRGAVAAPPPFFRAFNHLRPYRVQDYIPTCLEEVAVLLNENGLVSPLEEMARSFMPPVKGLGIDAVELSHADGEVAVRGFDDEVVMVAHETVGMADPVIALVHLLKDVEKGVSVPIVLEYGLPFVPAGGDVIDRAWIFYAQRTGHETKIP